MNLDMIAGQIAEADIYRILRTSELKTQATPDEKVTFINGCPTLLKKNRLEILLGRVFGKPQRMVF